MAYDMYDTVPEESGMPDARHLTGPLHGLSGQTLREDGIQTLTYLDTITSAVLSS